MTDFLDRLAVQLAHAERTTSTTAAVPAHRRWRARRTVILALATTLGATGAALAATGVLSAGPVSLDQYRAGEHATLVSVVPPSQAAAFAILRRPATASDALPASMLPEQFIHIYGANPALARRVQGLPQGAEAWLVPGNGSLCLVTNSGASCGPDATLIKYGLAIESGSGSGSQSVTGVVPDGVTSVTITLGSGSQQDATVVDNGYTATADGPSPIARFALNTPSGPVSIPG
jgi:hypothetical protein